MADSRSSMLTSAFAPIAGGESARARRDPAESMATHGLTAAQPRALADRDPERNPGDIWDGISVTAARRHRAASGSRDRRASVDRPRESNARPRRTVTTGSGGSQSVHPTGSRSERPVRPLHRDARFAPQRLGDDQRQTRAVERMEGMRDLTTAATVRPRFAAPHARGTAA